MIDPDTGWFEMAQILNKTAAEIADNTKKTWFTRYPLPQRIVFDCGTKFMDEFAKMCQNYYVFDSLMDAFDDCIGLRVPSCYRFPF